jgi:hypothetical protein
LIAGVAGIAICAAVVVAPTANADTTAFSEFYKTAENLTNGTTASSASSPDGQTTGTARPGDRLKWVLHYQNRTAGNATVDVRDLLSTSGTYVDGSLELPPSANESAPFGAQYTTDGGTTWQDGEPPAGADGVGMTGSFPPETQTQAMYPQAPAAVNLSNGAGDGYNAVSSADGTLVYAVYHHNNTNVNVFCATAAGGLCPGWPVGSNTTATYVSPVAGTPIGTGTNGMSTAWQNGTFLADGKLYWAAAKETPVAASYPVGIMCLDLSTLHSCGFTQLDTTLLIPVGGEIGGTGIPATDGNYYYADTAGNLLCFNPSSGACGVRALGTASTTADTLSATYGNLVFSVTWNISTSRFQLSCTNVVVGAPCAGYPVTVTNAGYNGPGYPRSPIVPFLTSTGQIAGMCALSSSAVYGCWDMTGAAVASPYPAGTGITQSSAADTYVTGTRAYVQVNGGNSVGCFDFALPRVGGIVQPCAGFTPVPDPWNYTVRPIANNPTCLLADGDGRQIRSFDAFTGGACSSTIAHVTVAPARSYCGTGVASFRSWDRFSITGAPTGSFAGATVTLTDADGNVVPGYSDVVVTQTAQLDISAIPTTAPTDRLTATVDFRTATETITSAQIGLSWVGNPPELCYQTVVPQAACGLATDMVNDGTAITDATAAGNGTDSPAGNTTGPVRFTVMDNDAGCQLHFQKTVTPDHLAPGGLATYTIRVQNTGTVPYAAPNPPTFSDDLSAVLAHAAYNDDASASAGTISYAAPVLSWRGPDSFAPGSTATITYTVRVGPDAGTVRMPNRVVSQTIGSNCPDAATDPDCDTVLVAVPPNVPPVSSPPVSSPPVSSPPVSSPPIVPPVSSAPIVPPASSPPNVPLARTGTSVLPLIGVAALLLTVGIILVRIARRRRHPAD